MQKNHNLFYPTTKGAVYKVIQPGNWKLTKAVTQPGNWELTKERWYSLHTIHTHTHTLKGWQQSRDSQNASLLGLHRHKWLGRSQIEILVCTIAASYTYMGISSLYFGEGIEYCCVLLSLELSLVTYAIKMKFQKTRVAFSISEVRDRGLQIRTEIYLLYYWYFTPFYFCSLLRTFLQIVYSWNRWRSLSPLSMGEGAGRHYFSRFYLNFAIKFRHLELAKYSFYNYSESPIIGFYKCVVVKLPTWQFSYSHVGSLSHCHMQISLAIG